MTPQQREAFEAMRKALSEIKLLLGSDTYRVARGDKSMMGIPEAVEIGNIFERANTAMELAENAVAEPQEPTVMLTSEQARSVLDGWMADTRVGECCVCRGMRGDCPRCRPDRKLAARGMLILAAAIKQAEAEEKGGSNAKRRGNL